MFFLKKVKTLCQFAGTRTHLLLRVSVGMLYSQFVVCHYRYYSKHPQLHFPEEQVR